MCGPISATGNASDLAGAPLSGNPLFRIRTACANCSMRRRFAPRCRRNSCRGTLPRYLGRGVQEDFPQAELHLARVRPSPAHRLLRVAEPAQPPRMSASRELCRWVREIGEDFSRRQRLLFGSEPRATMLRRYRRCFAALAALLLAIPPVVGLIAPDNPITVLKEGRQARAGPEHARGGQRTGSGLPAKVGRIFAGSLRAAARDDLIAQGPDQADAGPRRRGAGCAGRPGRTHVLSRRRFGAPERRPRSQRAAGRGFRRTRSPAWERRWKDEGIGFLVAIPPSSSTMYQESLPIWAQSHGRTTEYDLFPAGPRGRPGQDGRSAASR